MSWKEVLQLVAMMPFEKHVLLCPADCLRSSVADEEEDDESDMKFVQAKPLPHAFVTGSCLSEGRL